PAEGGRVARARRRPERRHACPRRRDDQPPPAPGGGRVRRRGLRGRPPRPRLPRAVGRRGAVGGVAQPPDGGDLQASVRDDERPVPRRSRVRGGASVTQENGLDRVWVFTQMLRIREFEERVKRTFEEHPGVIRGHTHLADGAEASIVGSLSTLRDGDQVLATYRCHGYPITLGTPTKAMMAEIYG